MSWTYELIQQTDQQGNLLPLWTVRQWNTTKPNEKWETTITTAVKDIAYPEE